MRVPPTQVAVYDPEHGQISIPGNLTRGQAVALVSDSSRAGVEACKAFVSIGKTLVALDKEIFTQAGERFGRSDLKPYDKPPRQAVRFEALKPRDLERLLPAGELVSLRNFADAAVRSPGPSRAAIEELVRALRGLITGGRRDDNPEQIAAMVELLVKFEDREVLDVHENAVGLTGFSLAILRHALRTLVEEKTFSLSPAEVLAAARNGRRFFADVATGARRQLDYRQRLDEAERREAAIRAEVEVIGQAAYDAVIDAAPPDLTDAQRVALEDAAFDAQMDAEFDASMRYAFLRLELEGDYRQQKAGLASPDNTPGGRAILDQAVARMDRWLAAEAERDRAAVAERRRAYQAEQRRRQAAESARKAEAAEQRRQEKLEAEVQREYDEAMDRVAGKEDVAGE